MQCCNVVCPPFLDKGRRTAGSRRPEKVKRKECIAMKKFLAMLLALAMAFSLMACGGNSEKGGNDGDKATGADAIPDTMTSDDGKYEVAFVTDVGNLKDKSFNQGTWDGVKLYANENGLSYKYYQPANNNDATDDDRYNAMKAAAEGGAKVIVCAGFLQEAALAKAAEEFPDANFVFIDNNHPVVGSNGAALQNVASVEFQEEQPGYLAGYAVVMEGYTKLGFSGGGGGSNPACCRYGYGFVQGANAAAKEKGVNVDMVFSWEYGATYQASTELQSMVAGWYNDGTEVVFACGGTMFNSITAAASGSNNDGMVIGVDVDQSGDSDTVITSAMKGIGEAAKQAIGKSYDGSWSEIGGGVMKLGAKEGAVGLPTETWSMKNFSVDDYNKLFNGIKDGSLVVDAAYDDPNGGLEQAWSNLTLNIK